MKCLIFTLFVCIGLSACGTKKILMKECEGVQGGGGHNRFFICEEID